MRLCLLLIPLAALAACRDNPPPGLCGEETKRCIAFETRDVPAQGGMRFQVRLSNLCREDVEYKLCFEVAGGTADCRQDVLEPARRAEQETPTDRFGGRTRLYVRYAREAKACRFPITPDVRF